MTKIRVVSNDNQKFASRGKALDHVSEGGSIHFCVEDYFTGNLDPEIVGARRKGKVNRSAGIHYSFGETQFDLLLQTDDLTFRHIYMDTTEKNWDVAYDVATAWVR